MSISFVGLVLGPVIGPLLGQLLSPLLADAAATPRQASDTPMGATLSVEAAGQCPQREAVMDALLPVVGKNAINPTQGIPRVSDLGDRFEVTAAGQTGQYADAARDCAERARVAAVFIALALNPPLPRSGDATAEIAPDPKLREPPPAEPPIEVAAPSERWKRLTVAGRIDGASLANGAPVAVAFAFGGEMRGALGKGSLGVVAGAGVLAPTITTFGSIPVRQQRFPFSLAAMARRRISASLEMGAELGASLTLVTLRAQQLDTVEPATRLDTGVRLSCEIRFTDLVRWMVPFVDVHAEFFPRPYVLDVAPLGDIGKTNRLWLGVSAGVTFESP